MLRVILTIVQVFASFAIVGLVLLQRGKGADAGAGFGAGASGTVFGARGAATALSHATAIFAGIFMVNSLLLTYVGTRAVAAPPKSILDTIATKPDTATPNGTGVVTPGAAPGAATTPGTSPAGAAAPPPAESPASTSTPPATGDATSTPAPAAAPAVTPTAQGPAATPAPAPAQPADGAAPK
jgi:preprotein translocase subunit SecG